MSLRFSRELDYQHPICNFCDSPLGFREDIYIEGESQRCFCCDPLGTMVYDNVYIGNERK